jgi:hypothetical protein
MSVHRLQESKKKTYTISRIKEKNHTVHEQLTDTIHEQFTNQDDYIHLVSKTYLDHGGPSRGPSAAPPHVDPLLPSLQASQLRLPCPTPLFLLPSLSGKLPMSGHGALTSAMTALSWRVLIKAIFLRGITKTDAHELPLAILSLNFIRNQL